MRHKPGARPKPGVRPGSNRRSCPPRIGASQVIHGLTCDSRVGGRRGERSGDKGASRLEQQSKYSVDGPRMTPSRRVRLWPIGRGASRISSAASEGQTVRSLWYNTRVHSAKPAPPSPGPAHRSRATFQPADSRGPRGRGLRVPARMEALSPTIESPATSKSLEEELGR